MEISCIIPQQVLTATTNAGVRRLAVYVQVMYPCVPPRIIAGGAELALAVRGEYFTSSGIDTVPGCMVATAHRPLAVA
jgi:ABC-type spermidine/putrescine transport system permease subunit I